MSEQEKWRVERYESGWTIRRPDGALINITPSWEVAITRAHRLARESRTVTIELPAKPQVMVGIPAGARYIGLGVPGIAGTVIIDSDPAVQEEVAIHLLAHARRRR